MAECLLTFLTMIILTMSSHADDATNDESASAERHDAAAHARASLHILPDETIYADLSTRVHLKSTTTFPSLTLSKDAAQQLAAHCDLYDFLVFSVFIGLICMFGLAGNVLSFIVLWKQKSETAAIFLLQCMAVCDFLLLVCSIFIYTLPAVHPYTGVMAVFEERFDVVQMYVWPVAMMLHTVTIWLTVLVTYNRYNAVCRAVEEFGSVNIKSTSRQVICVIVFSILYNCPRFFEHAQISGQDGLVINATMTTEEQHISRNLSITEENNNHKNNNEDVNKQPEHVALLGDNRIYQVVYSNIFYYPVMYIIPLGSLAYLNYKLIRSLNERRKRKPQPSLTAAATADRRRKEDHAITRCVVAIVCIFFVSQTPALLNQIFWATFDVADRDCGRFHFYYTKLSDLLVVINSSCNFVLYCLFVRTFRKIFFETFGCRGNGKKKSRGGTSQAGKRSAQLRRFDAGENTVCAERLPLSSLPSTSREQLANATT